MYLHYLQTHLVWIKQRSKFQQIFHRSKITSIYFEESWDKIKCTTSKERNYTSIIADFKFIFEMSRFRKEVPSLSTLEDWWAFITGKTQKRTKIRLSLNKQPYSAMLMYNDFEKHERLIWLGFCYLNLTLKPPNKAKKNKNKNRKVFSVTFKKLTTAWIFIKNSQITNDDISSKYCFLFKFLL